MVLTPSLADVILAAMEARLALVHTSLPGHIVAYNASEQTATVQVSVKSAYIDEVGDRVVEAIPPLQRVPVEFLGGGGFRTTYPVAAGDTCLLVITSCSLDRVLSLGGVVDPADDRRHDLSDAVAIVGLRTYNSPLKNAPTDRMSLGSDTGATVEISQSTVKLGGNDASQAVVLGTTYRSAEDTLLTALNTFVIAVATQASPLGPYPNPALLTACGALTTAIASFQSAASTYLSSTVKAK